MTATTNDTTTTPVPPVPDDEIPGDTTQSQSEDTETEQPDQLDEPDETTPNREAAKWRTKLRAAEAERDALAERLTDYQRREVESTVASVLAAPADLWVVGRAELSQFFGDEGELDVAAVRAVAEALVRDRPGLAAGIKPQRMQRGEYSGQMPGDGPNWRDVLR